MGRSPGEASDNVTWRASHVSKTDVGTDERDAERGEVEPRRIAQQEQGGDDDRQPHDVTRECGDARRLRGAVRGPRDEVRGGEEVREHDRQSERGADRALYALDETGDEHDRGTDEQPALDEVERDVALYGRDCVHGLPSSSRSMRARYW